jgi:hypothetical protein
LSEAERPAKPNNMNALIAEARRMALSKGQRPASKGMPVVYLLRLRSGVIYIGASEDLEQRMKDHLSGRACRTTALDVPLAFLRVEAYPTFSGKEGGACPLRFRCSADAEPITRLKE